MDLNQILENMGNWVIGPGVRIFLVLIITLVLIKAARLGLDYVFAPLQPP